MDDKNSPRVFESQPQGGSGELERRRAELFGKISPALGLKKTSDGAAGQPERFNGLPYILLLAVVVLFAIYTRTRNLGLLAGKYLIELDSYLWYRYAKIIFETGTLPAIDTARYVPVGTPTQPYYFFSATLAYFYKAIHAVLPSLPQISWHVYYPVVVTAISLPFFFLFVRKITNERVAILATAFLVVIPAYIQRTSAGFADHEAMAMLWMFASLMFFAYFWTEKNWKRAVLFGVLGGMFAGAMAGTWGGYPYLFITLGLFVTGALLLARVSFTQFIGYLSFYVALSIIFTITRFVPLLQYLKSLDSIYVLFPILAYLFYHASIRLPALSGLFGKFDNYLPRQAVTTGVLTVVGILVSELAGIVNLVGLYQGITRTSPNRWTTTVAENATPYLFGSGGWWDSFGWLLIISFIAATALAIYLFKNKNHSLLDTKSQKYAYIAGAIYVLFFSGFIFGRYNSGGGLQFLINFFSNYYITWLMLSLAAAAALYVYIYFKDRQAFNNIFTEDKWPLILMFVFFNFTLIGSRILIRLIFGLSPAVALICAWFIVVALEKLAKTEKARIVAIALALATIFVFYSLAVTTIGINNSMGSMVPGQWESSMNFLRDKTPQNSTVAHWWDYGHMTTTVGERRAVTDGGNLMSWNYASGRYFLTGKDKTSTLEYFKTHDVNYFLISSQEILKYYAFSLIGSDDKLDRLSTIGAFGFQGTREARDGQVALYGSQWGFDQDIPIGDTILPRGGAAIVGFSLLQKANGTIEPKAYVEYQGKQAAFDISCIYKHTIDPKTNQFHYGPRFSLPETSNTIKGCLVLVPTIDSSKVAQQGAAFWLSEKVWDTNFARLYMYGEQDENFKLVYSDSLPIAFYSGQIIGPIKIWEVNYPNNIKADPKYLAPSENG